MDPSIVLKCVLVLCFVVVTIPGGYCVPCRTVGLKNSSQEGPCYSPDEFYYNATKRCYLVGGEQGPCGEMMVLSQDPGTRFAKCKCKEPLAEGCEGRPIVFWPEKSRCFNIFDQGPCKSNEWLVVEGKTNVTRCQRNPCKSLNRKQTNESVYTSELAFTFSHNGTCYDTRTRAFCEEYEKVYFIGSSFQPVCSDRDLGCNIAFGIGVVARLSCPNGQERDSFGGCSPLANFS